MSSDEVADYLKARDYSIECLSYVWNKSKPQIETLISEHETSLSTSGVGFITDAFDMLSDGIIQSILQEKENALKTIDSIKKRELTFFQQIIPSLSDVFKDLFYGYLENTKYDLGNEHISKLAKNFAKYNIDLRYPKIASNPPRDPKTNRLIEWQYDYTDEILDSYDKTVTLTHSLRNFVSHVKDPETKKLLTKLDRKITEPVNESNSSGNIFVLISMVTLVIHEFREVLQTWLDTIKLGGTP